MPTIPRAPQRPSPPPATYSIVRMYESGEAKIIRRGLPRSEAEAHCRDPETSSNTATSPEAKAHTEAYGPWFDGYMLDN